jgi:hypothetical protein
MLKELDISEIPFRDSSKDRPGFENRVGPDLVSDSEYLPGPLTLGWVL